MFRNSELRADATIGRVPEIRYTTSGKAVANFSVAINRGKRDENKTPIWKECTAWEYLAETSAGNFKKGDAVHVVGYLDLEEWEKDGQQKSKEVLVLSDIYRRVFKPKEGSASDQQQPVPPPNSGYETGQVPKDDVPF